MKFAVIGYGVVGRHMAEDVRRVNQELVVYDPFVQCCCGASQDDVNACDAAFVCVGTPQGADGRADLSAIDEVFGWLDVPVAIIRSTVPPGTTVGLAQRQHERVKGGCGIVFCPEFIGEGVNAPYNAMRQPPFVIVGGEPDARAMAINALSRIYNAECEFVPVGSLEAEIAKYAENYFLALKVTWANEMYDICKHEGADFAQMMGALTHDYRIGRSHTHVYADARGWGGRCLPKDTAALLAHVGPKVAPLLAAVRTVNDKHRSKS